MALSDLVSQSLWQWCDYVVSSGPSLPGRVRSRGRQAGCSYSWDLLQHACSPLCPQGTWSIWLDCFYSYLIIEVWWWIGVLSEEALCNWWPYWCGNCRSHIRCPCLEVPVSFSFPVPLFRLANICRLWHWDPGWTWTAPSRFSAWLPISLTVQLIIYSWF